MPFPQTAPLAELAALAAAFIAFILAEGSGVKITYAAHPSDPTMAATSAMMIRMFFTSEKYTRKLPDAEASDLYTGKFLDEGSMKR